MQALKRVSKLLMFMCLGFLSLSAVAQDKLNAITTGVPFLNISPEARGGAMGDAGVASSPDVYSMHWNPAKYAFTEGAGGLAVSYSPWMRQVVDDIGLMYVNGYYRLDDKQTLAASLRYFRLGEIQFTDNEGHDIAKYSPNEFAIDAAYARKLTPNFGISVAGRFIYSNLTLGQSVGGVDSRPGTSVAADVALYGGKDIRFDGMNTRLSYGMNISNIGAKISYRQDDKKDFIPTNLKLGTALAMELDAYNKLTVMVDVNKLLVPTPPRYLLDENNQPVKDAAGNQVIDQGKDPDVSVVKGIFQSFNDAPDGFSEEMRELMYSVGIEYWYDKQFAVRGGYFHEDKTKGGRQFFSLGAGLKYNVFGLDFSYLIPTEQRNPLDGTLRFSLTFNFEALEKD